MSSLTGYVFDKPVLERIAMERGVNCVTSFAQLSERDKDLIMADLLFVIYTSPTQTSSISKSHGNFSQTIGSQYISDKKNIYELMMKLYNKWNDPKAGTVNVGGNGLQWME